MEKGWISLNRSLLDHWIWKDSNELSKAEAWIYLLMAANHSEKPKKVVIKDKVLMCGRGESLRSLETLSKDWNWNRSKVRRFLKVLEKENMIRHASETVTSRISICNYDTYQTNKSESETHLKRKRNAFETHSTTNNNDNNENKTDDADFIFYGIDIRTLNQCTRQGKQRTKEQLIHIAKLEAEGITID